MADRKWSKVDKHEKIAILSKFSGSDKSMFDVCLDLEKMGVVGQTRNAVIGFINRNMPDYRHSGKTGGERNQPSRIERIKKLQAEKNKQTVKKTPTPKKVEVVENRAKKNQDKAQDKAPSTDPVRYEDMTSKHCKWPLWDDETKFEDYTVCGGDRKQDSSYCPHHHKK